MEIVHTYLLRNICSTFGIWAWNSRSYLLLSSNAMHLLILLGLRYTNLIQASCYIIQCETYVFESNMRLVLWDTTRFALCGSWFNNEVMWYNTIKVSTLFSSPSLYPYFVTIYFTYNCRHTDNCTARNNTIINSILL